MSLSRSRERGEASELQVKKGKILYLYPFNRLIGLVGRIFANGTGDQGSISGLVIPKTFKIVLDTSLLNAQNYKVRIKGKVEQSREMCSALPQLLIRKPSGHPRLRLTTLLTYFNH